MSFVNFDEMFSAYGGNQSLGAYECGRHGQPCKTATKEELAAWFDGVARHIESDILKRDSES